MNDIPSGLVNTLVDLLGRHHAEHLLPAILAAADTHIGPATDNPTIDITLAVQLHRILGRAHLAGLFPELVAAAGPYLHGRPEAVEKAPDGFLTDQEMDILVALARGRTNLAIGRSMGVALDTAKTRVRKLLEKLGAADRTNAVHIAWERGLLPDRRSKRRLTAA